MTKQTKKNGSENRRIRFAGIDGISRRDIPLAATVWLDDLRGQSWISRDIIKIATYFARYMVQPDEFSMGLRHVESACRLESKQVIEALTQMQMFGAIEAYSVDDGLVRASLNLNLLLRLQILEALTRFAELNAIRRRDAKSPALRDKKRWAPPCPADLGKQTEKTGVELA